MNIENLEGSKVLIVDDNKDNIIILFEYLKTLGFKLLVAQSGEDALEIVAETLPDIILLDIIMPGIGGFETCERLKQNPVTRGIPVLFVSSLSDTDDKIRAFEAGGVDYITKPFRSKEVFARITTHLFLYKMKKELEEKNLLLKQEIEEREQAEKKAEAASRAKSEFLANMSHELRTPLNGILGYAQILKRDKSLTESQLKGVEIIERSGNHLLNLINDILDLSKIEARKMELYPSDFDFPAFLDGIVEMIHIQAEKKGIAFSFSVDDLPSGVNADEKRLSQVLINILGNAVKYTDHGEINFTVKKLPIIEKNSVDTCIRFQVQDTGIGIEQEKLKTIFSAFTHAAHHSHAESTGLGLAISRSLVQLMGGELQVISELGKGSTFWFDLKFPKTQKLYADKLRHDERRIIGFKGKKRKILVVDDRWENRTILVTLLAPLGFEIEEAADGREGLSNALKFNPDLIFMDLIMPVMDGFEASRQIKKSSGLESVKIIAVSASTLMPPEQICAEIGCDAYIRKPFQVQDVLDNLAFYLDIEWIYENDECEMMKKKIINNDECGIMNKDFHHSSFPIPSANEIKALYELAQDGNFQELKEKIDNLEHAAPQYAGFVKEVRNAAKTLDEDAVCKFLDQYKDSGQLSVVSCQKATDH